MRINIAVLIVQKKETRFKGQIQLLYATNWCESETAAYQIQV